MMSVVRICDFDKKPITLSSSHRLAFLGNEDKPEEIYDICDDCFRGSINLSELRRIRGPRIKEAKRGPGRPKKTEDPEAESSRLPKTAKRRLATLKRNEPTSQPGLEPTNATM